MTEAEKAAFACYNLALAILREKGVRCGDIKPSHKQPNDKRWASEGPRPEAELDTVREAA